MLTEKTSLGFRLASSLPRAPRGHAPERRSPAPRKRAPLGFAWGGHAGGLFDLALLASVPSRFVGVMLNEVLVAVPLFIFMGVMLERSRLAEELLETMGRLLGSVRDRWVRWLP